MFSVADADLSSELHAGSRPSYLPKDLPDLYCNPSCIDEILSIDPLTARTRESGERPDPQTVDGLRRVPLGPTASDSPSGTCWLQALDLQFEIASGSASSEDRRPEDVGSAAMYAHSSTALDSKGYAIRFG